MLTQYFLLSVLLFPEPLPQLLHFFPPPEPLPRSLPHIHAEYDGYNISIAIDTAKILAGNLPHKQEKVATEWVKKHKDQLLGKWNDIAVSGTAMYTKSGIGTLEE